MLFGAISLLSGGIDGVSVEEATSWRIVFVLQSAGWPTLLVAALNPVYFCLRRKAGLDTLTVFLMEIALLMVPSVVLIAIGVTSRVAGSGADATYGPLFAMFSYLEPVLILVTAALLGEPLTLEDGLVYGPVVIALALMTLSMLRRRPPRTKLRSSRKRRNSSPRSARCGQSPRNSGCLAPRSPAGFGGSSQLSV